MSIVHFPVVTKPGRLLHRTNLEDDNVIFLPIGEAMDLVEIKDDDILGLQFEDSSSDDLRSLADVSDQHIDHIILDRCDIFSHSMEFVWQLRHLRAVELYDCVLYQGLFSKAHNAGSLQYVRLDGCHIVDDVFHNMNMPMYFREFSFFGTQLTNSRLRFIDSVPDLTMLDLSSTDTADEDLPIIAQLHLLRDLHLDDTAVTNAGLVILETLSGLEHVTLTGTAVTVEAVNHLKMVLPRCMVEFGSETHISI